jgi:hypothetical protein
MSPIARRVRVQPRRIDLSTGAVADDHMTVTVRQFRLSLNELPRDRVGNLPRLGLVGAVMLLTARNDMMVFEAEAGSAVADGERTVRVPR